MKTTLIALLQCVLYWVMFIFFLLTIGTYLSPMFPASWERFVYGIFGTIAALTATWIWLKYEKKSFAEFGLIWGKSTLFKFFKGLLIGTGVFALILLLLIGFTDLTIEKSPDAWDPLTTFWYLSIIPLALMEEIAFRAYPLIKLNRVFGIRSTQLILAVAFALYHIATGWGIPMAFLGPGIWALVFGLAAIWSNGIALPTGIHVALNLIQQLIGMSSSNHTPLWVLKQPDNMTQEAMDHADFIGLLSQILVLAGALVLTEVYIRRKP